MKRFNQIIYQNYPNIFYYIQVFLHFKYYIIIWAIIFSFAGYVFTLVRKPTYSGKIVFALEQNNNQSSLLGLASQFGINFGSNGNGLDGDNLLKVMKSRTIIQSVLLNKSAVLPDQSFLIDHYIKTDKLLFKQFNKKKLYPVSAIENSKISDSAIGVIYDRIVEHELKISKTNEKLSFVEVTYIGHDELFTDLFVRNLVDFSTRFYLENKFKTNRNNILRLQYKVDSVNFQLKEAMLDLAKSQELNSFTTQNVAKVDPIIKQTRVTMLGALYTELVKNHEITKTLSIREEPVITIIDYPHYPLKVKEFKLKFVLLGLFFGLLTSFIGAIFYDKIISSKPIYESPNT